MVKKRTYKDPLSAAMDWYLRVTGTTADALGLSIGYKNGKMIGHIRTGLSTGSELKRRDIAEYFGYPYEEFLKIGQSIIDGTFTTTPIKITAQMTGQMTDQMTAQMTEPPKRRKTDIEIQTDKNHKELVGRFINKDVAIDINQGLLALEEIEGRDVLLEIKGVVNQMLRQAEKKRGTVNPANGTEGN